MNKFDMGFTYGLRAPETAEEVQRQTTLNGMREAIEKAQWDSPIIRSALQAARYTGLNGEDTYTLLAYHALLSLENHAQRNSELLRLMPVRPITVPRELLG